MAIMDGPRERLAALQAGVEELMGMTSEQYADLCVDDPDEAERVLQEAIERAKEREQ